MTYDGRDMDPISPRSLELNDPDWRDRTGNPHVYLQKSPDSFWVVPVPSSTKTDGLIISVDYLDDSYVGVQMSIGDIYDETTLEVTGQYNNGSTLPIFVNVDDIINVQDLGWYKIIDTIFVDGIQTAILDLLTRSLSFTIGQNGESKRVTSVYNILEYEIYEYD